MIWILAILILATTVQADVTRSHKITSQFMGSSESTTTDYYMSDKQATESTIKWTSGMMKTMSGGKEQASGNIVRLDKEVIWALDHKKKTYTEMTFAEFREMMKKGMKEMEGMEGAEEEAPDTTAEEMYTWTVEDKSDPQPKTILGYSCKNAHIVATGVNKNEPNDQVIITFNMWNSTEVPGAQEITDFQTRYMKALGLDIEALTPGLMQAVMLYQKQFEQLVEAAKKAPGEPVQNLIEIKRQQLKGVSLKKAVSEGAKEELLGKLPFGKKKKEEKKEEKPEWEMKVKFSVNTELTQAAASAVEATRFDVPAGYKLKK
ncbi:hypothetical protein EHM69_06330 [candidate division KSB1 bacterium]|nr:MAG: hypothetical protein EHM69_06330 [candidate division KSB1 bacterium]